MKSNKLFVLERNIYILDFGFLLHYFEIHTLVQALRVVFPISFRPGFALFEPIVTVHNNIRDTNHQTVQIEQRRIFA